MRHYKPYTAVVAALKESEFLEVVDNKYVRRKEALLQSQLDEAAPARSMKEKKRSKTDVKPITPLVSAAEPYVTKGMVRALLEACVTYTGS